MATIPNTPEGILGILMETPGKIRALTGNIDPDVLRTAPAVGEWSVNEILAHLRAAADVWEDGISRMLVEEQPTLRAGNPSARMKRSGYADQPFEESLEAFTEQRMRLLDMLGSLPEDGWARSANIVGSAGTRVQTVQHYARRIASHEPLHIEQIAAAIEAVQG